MSTRIRLRRAILLLTTAYLLPLSAAQNTGLDTCTSVHTFLSRGYNEPYPGRQGKLVQAICSGLGNSSCDYEDIVYNNAFGAEYCGAVVAGRRAGVAQITAYNRRCPDTKLVLSGYSQGAHVLGDILGSGGGGGGGGGEVFMQGCTTPKAAGIERDAAPGRMGKLSW